jgi:hypothetical protein
MILLIFPFNVVITWLNKQINEKMTLTVKEFDKYAMKPQPSSTQSSDASSDYRVKRALVDQLNLKSNLMIIFISLLQPITSGSLENTHRVIYKPTSYAIQNENKLDGLLNTTTSLSSDSSVASGGPSHSTIKTADEANKMHRYPLKSTSLSSKPSSYF